MSMSFALLSRVEGAEQMALFVCLVGKVRLV